MEVSGVLIVLVNSVGQHYNSYCDSRHYIGTHHNDNNGETPETKEETSKQSTFVTVMKQSEVLL